MKGLGRLPCFVLIGACVAVDQLVKLLVRENIPLYGSVDFIPYIMDLTYVKNTGMAFSLLSGHTWLLALLSATVTAVLLWALVKGMFRHPMGVIPLCLVTAGAIGNLIDRVFLGFVTDMFRTLFIHFAVFNVADIWVTVGGVLLVVYFLFFYEKLEGKREGVHGGGNQDG